MIDTLHRLNLVSVSIDINVKNHMQNVNILEIPVNTKGLLNEKQILYSIPAR